MEGAGERGILVPSVVMLSGEITYFCNYGRYFLIGYYLSEIENLLLLAEHTKENIQFEIAFELCDLRVSLSSQSENLYHSSNWWRTF